jgi:tetratricopeptide (TPR) repeat protein
MPDVATGRFEKYQAALQQGHDELRQGRLKQSLAAYRSAADIGEQRAQPHVLAAGVLIRLGKFKDAVAEYDKAIALDPDDRSAVAGKAGALRAMGRTKAADEMDARLADLEEEAEALRLASAVAGAGGEGSAEGLLVTAERMVGKGRRELAIKAWLAAAELYAGAGHLEAALDTCLQALTTDAGSPSVHLELSKLYFQHGWHQRGADHLLLLDKLLSLEPNADVRSGVSELAARYSTLDNRLEALLTT